jgi:hypothetical protein
LLGGANQEIFAVFCDGFQIIFFGETVKPILLALHIYSVAKLSPISKKLKIMFFSVDLRGVRCKM